jgi:hypothetical protein
MMLFYAIGSVRPQMVDFTLIPDLALPGQPSVDKSDFASYNESK